MCCLSFHCTLYILVFVYDLIAQLWLHCTRTQFCLFLFESWVVDCHCGYTRHNSSAKVMVFCNRRGLTTQIAHINFEKWRHFTTLTGLNWLITASRVIPFPLVGVWHDPIFPLSPDFVNHLIFNLDLFLLSPQSFRLSQLFLFLVGLPCFDRPEIKIYFSL